MSTVYSALKLFKFPDRLEALAQGKVAAPVHVRIKPVNACNHNCWFCAYRSENLELGKLMNLRDKLQPEKMREIAHDLVDMGVKAVTFSGGGEPLLFRALPETIDTLARGGIKIGCLTNGAFLKGAMSAAFAQHGTWIRVSMNGWDGLSYAKSRGVSEREMDKVLTNIENFARLKSQCALGISYIVAQDNGSHIFEFCKMVKSLGVQTIKISGCVVGNSGKENNEYHRSIQEVVTQQIEKARTLEDDTFKIFNHYHELDERFDKSYQHCHFLQFLTVIGADSKVYTCQDKAYTESGLLGSIDGRSFKEFWFSEENKARMKSINPCVDCKHHCVSHRKNLLIDEFLDLEPGHSEFV